MRVVVTGGRTLFNAPMVYDVLTRFQREIFPIGELIHGDAEGLDRTAAYVAYQMLGIPVISVPADWSNVTTLGAVIKYRRGGIAYNALAGHWRNQRMIDEFKPSYGIVFSGGTGTADMRNRLEIARVPIYDA